jgi:hypothetical protein
MEADASSGVPMDRPGGGLMATASESDDIAMVGVDMDFALPSSDPSPEQPVSFLQIPCSIPSCCSDFLLC